MTTAIPTLIAGYWKLFLIAAVMAFAAMQTLRLDSTQKDVALLEGKIETAAEVHRIAQARSTQALEKVNADHVQKEADARANAAAQIKRLVAELNARRTRSVGVLSATSQAGTITDASARQIDAGQPDAVVDLTYQLTYQLADQCAKTTVLFNEWRELCAANHCEVVQ